MAAEEAAHRDFLRLPFQVQRTRSVPSYMASASSTRSTTCALVAQFLLLLSPLRLSASLVYSVRMHAGLTPAQLMLAWAAP